MHTLPVNRLKHQRGQGMTEYIVIVALIAVAAIGATNYFGRTVRNQVGAMGAALAGNQAEANTSGEQARQAGEAGARSGRTEKSLGNYTQDVGAQ